MTIELDIPGRGWLRLQHLVLDVNGTIAIDGVLVDRISRPLTALRDRLTIHLISADTYGRQEAIDRALNLRSTRLNSGDEAEQKAEYVKRLGAQQVVAIGQGANDAGMLREAGLGIAILSAEGLARQSLEAADLLVPDIYAALDLLEHPVRILSTLRR
ncbi:MAG: HAD hydrolase family protein [Anaerolineales bacterium]